MSAKHALLGFLLDRPTYPYQLANRLEGRLGPAWKINSGQVYQTMERLARDGLIERVGGGEDEDDDPRRHVFAITDRGVEEFERWFDRAKTTVRLSRRPLLLKITLAGPERLKDLLEEIDAYERDCAALVTELVRVRDENPAHGLRVRADQVLRRVSLTADIAQVEAELQWARQGRDMVSRLLTQPDAIWPSIQERSAASTDEPSQDARDEVFGRMASRHLRLACGGHEP